MGRYVVREGRYGGATLYVYVIDGERLLTCRGLMKSTKTFMGETERGYRLARARAEKFAAEMNAK